MTIIVSFVFGIIELIVGLRFVFLLIGASTSSAFVNWIYGVSNPLVAPFSGILGQPSAVPTGTFIHSVFDPAALIALIVYGIVGGILASVARR